ncbi:MAG TPA: thiamine-phosphate kinase [Egibacteraceae bacterium]|nr:thiamine-phosphate kinase [Egibacteraceae bacterium]
MAQRPSASPAPGHRPGAGGEFDLIERLGPYLAGAARGLVVGPGDDAAVLEVNGRAVCLSVDVVVEEVHFRRDLSSFADVGWKAVAVNCSDLAAMGARPSAAVVGLCRPRDVAPEAIESLYRGMAEACSRWGLLLVGGDTVASATLVVALTAVGEVDPSRAVRRSGARPGDRLVVVGALGSAAAALAQVAGGMDADPALLAAHRRPRALVDAGGELARRGATAMIDVSDGLGADLGHLCAASGVRAAVRAAALPVAAGVAAAAAAVGADLWEVACGGGEDYALLAAVPAEVAATAAQAAGEAEGVPAAVVGDVVAPEAGSGPAALLVLPDGSTRDLAGMGWDHYPKERA